VVLLDTGLALDEHQDYLFDGIANVTRMGPHLTPHTNLGVQTEIIRRADRFVGTCGSLAWLAPMLGTDTLAIYQDDHLLTSHLYAARHAYATMKAARFTALDLGAASVLPGWL
jgi:ADP-heptose:LPS heptosyltransferase